MSALFFRLSITELALAAAAGLGLTMLNLYLTSAVLHRGLSHAAIRYPRRIERGVPLWLWLTGYIPPLTWIAAHRHHHAHSDTPQDPHSPRLKGLWHVFFLSWFYVPSWTRPNWQYAEERYLQRFRADRFLHFIDAPKLCAFNFWGQAVASILAGPAMTVFWFCRTVPFMLAIGYVNAFGHTKGTRTFENLGTDAVTLWQRTLAYAVAGETLGHNFHHRFASSATVCPDRFDPGFWFAVRILKGTPAPFAKRDEA